MQTKTLRYITVETRDEMFAIENVIITHLTSLVDMVVFNNDGRNYLLSPMDLALQSMRVGVYNGRAELNHHLQHTNFQTINLTELDPITTWSPPIDCVLEELSDKLKDLRNADTEPDGDTDTNVPESS